MIAVRFDHVSKQFTLRRERPRSFQELFLDLARMHRRPSREKYWALSDVSFEIESGEVVAIIGPNGAGKSTVLKLMSRIIAPTSGTVRLDGQVGALLELGAGFHPDLTGRENIYLNGSILGFSKAKMDHIYEDILDFSEMERFIDVQVKHYSSGMYMRLAFSIAIHLEPDILLVDEVLAVGDQAFQLRCLDKINEMKRRGVTIVLVSHTLDVVRDMCSRAIWLDDGQIRAQGAVDRVLEQYMAEVLTADERALQKAETTRQQAEGASKAADDESEDAATEDESAWRWGSREAEIVRVQLLDGAGRGRRAFRTGEPFVARMHYMARPRIESPLFGAAIHHVDGFHICGPNTGFADYPIEAIEGNGFIDFIIPNLPLLRGTYLLSAALYDQAGQQAYDHHHMAYTFRVVPSKQIRERYGSIHVASHWQLGSRSPVEANTGNGDTVR
jgi:ABC-type polysaccharide/polyol phosphate transport system ATPase subunit